MSNYLENKRCYLGGPIQYATNTDWRTGPKKVLVDEFKFNLFDPFDDPKQQWAPTLSIAQNNRDYGTMQKIARNFVKKDLAIVDRSDIIISFVPYKVPTTGVTHEIINGNNAKKPTLLVTDCDDISYIPLWYYGFIPLEFMFAGWEPLYKYLREVNNGEHKDNDRWSFVYGLI